MSPDEIIEELAELNPEALLADGFEEALVGYAQQSHRGPFALYDYDQCVRILESKGLTQEQALEHMSFNVTGAWVGEQTPLFAVLKQHERP